MSLPLVSVGVFGPLPEREPQAVIDVNPRVTAVEFETEIPGGFGPCQIGLLAPDADRPALYPYLPEPVDIGDKGHVEVEIGGHLVHEGVVQRVSANRRGFESLGYGRAALQWGGLDNPGNGTATSRALVLEALRAVPWLAVGQIEETGVVHQWSEFWYQSAAEVIDALGEQGGGDPATPWLYTVYEDRLVRFVAKLAPAVADYRLSYDPARMDVEWDYSEVVDAVRMRYRGVDGVERLTPWLYRIDVDPNGTYLRRATLNASADSAGIALQLLATYLAERSAPRLSGSIKLGPDDGLAQPGGAQRAGWLARAGEWVEMEGFGMVPIMRTKADMASGSAELELAEPPAASLAGMIQRALQAAAALRTKNDPISRQRLRF